MSIRVCAGKYRSRRLETPARGVRPTTDFVKQAIFSTIPLDLTGTHVLDLFAGSGSLGIEALSRGSEAVTFVDSSRLSVQVIERNIQSLNAREQVKIIRSDVRSFIEKCREEFDVVFMDPPYNKGLASQSAPHVYKLVKIRGLLVIEHSPGESIPIRPWKTRTYGDTMITYCMRDES